jgi:hypothetical protein
MPPVGFEPTISAAERQKTYTLDRAASGTGIKGFMDSNFEVFRKKSLWSVCSTVAVLA